MANITNFKPGETLTAEALNQAFDLVGARADAVIGIAQEAKEDAAEALARVDQATEHVPELIEKVEEIEEVIPNLATAASVTATQAAAQSYADTVGVNTAVTAKAYTDSQVEIIETQIETLASEVTAQGAEIDEVAGVLEGKADANAVYTKDETYNKSQIDVLYDVVPQLASGTVIARVITPNGTKPLYAPQGGSSGSSVIVNRIVTTGVHIADLIVDGVTYELYAPEGGTGGVTIEEVIAEIEEHLEAYSTTAQVTASLELKADKATTYSKTEVDTALAGKADTSAVVAKDEIIMLAGRKTTIMGFSKECFYKVVGQGTTYGFQYNDGVFTPENRGIQNTTAAIQLQVYARSTSAKIPIDVFVDSENNRDKCIITWDTTTLCTISGEQQSDTIEVSPGNTGVHTMTISYVKNQSSDKGIDACAVRIGTPCIESAGGGSGVTIEEVDAEIEEYLEDYSTTSEMNAALAEKANASTTYTKAEVDAAIEDKADMDDVYDKPVVDAKLAAKANAATTYTKTEVNAALAEKAEADEVYSKSEVDAALSEKLNSSIYYGYVNNRPIDTYLYINYPGMPSTADADFTVYASLNNDPTKNYEVTVVLDDPDLKFKSITYDAESMRYAITFPKEAAGHTCRVHIQEVPS